MLLLLLPLLLSGCVDEFPVTREVPYGGDGKGLSVEEAKTFFESYVSGKASRSAGPEEHDNGFYIRRLMLPSRPRTAVSRGEGDWTDDFWDDWWDDTFGDAPWYDDNYNDSDNPLDTSNDNFTFVGTDGWGDPIYCNSDDGTYYIDIDGDGFVDSAYVYDEGDSYEPGTGEEGNPEDDIMTPIDPDPLPDPGDTSTDSDEGGSGEVEQGGDGNNQQSQSPPPAPFNEAEQKKVNSLLSILEKNHGINPSKYTIMKSNNCNVIAKIEKSGIIVLCNEFFNKPELSDIDRLATIWHET